MNYILSNVRANKITLKYPLWTHILLSQRSFSHERDSCFGALDKMELMKWKKDQCQWNKLEPPQNPRVSQSLTSVATQQDFTKKFTDNLQMQLADFDREAFLLTKISLPQLLKWNIVKCLVIKLWILCLFKRHKGQTGFTLTLTQALSCILIGKKM